MYVFDGIFLATIHIYGRWNYGKGCETGEEGHSAPHSKDRHFGSVGEPYSGYKKHYARKGLGITLIIPSVEDNHGEENHAYKQNA